MPVRNISTEEEVRKINYYRLGEIKSFNNIFSENNELIEVDVAYWKREDIAVKLRFRNMKLLKYFVTKLSRANFKRTRMNIKYGMTLLVILSFIFSLIIPTHLDATETRNECINEELLNPLERSPEYNLLSFPAVSANDPYIIAVSFFNNKMNVIVREDYVTQYEFKDVPYSAYKTFLSMDDKMEYYSNCLENIYDVVKVY